MTRCHSASSPFSAVFGFRKVVLEIFSELDTAKTEVPIFPGRIQKSEGESKMGPGGPTPCPGAAHPLARLDLVWGPWWPPGVAPPPIYSLPPKNPKGRSLHPRKVPQPPSSSTLVRGTEISVPAPCRDGELPPGSHLHRLHRHLHRRC